MPSIAARLLSWSRAVPPFVLLLVAAAAATVVAGAEESPGRRILGRPGYLIIEAARDSTQGFTWRAEPGQARHSLAWPQGHLSAPDTVPGEPFSARDLGFTCRASLAGSGASGQLILADGIYPVSEPIVLADGVLELHLTGGELEIRGEQIRYRAAPTAAPSDQRAGYLMLAGIVLLITVLLRRARGRRRPGHLA